MRLEQQVFLGLGPSLQIATALESLAKVGVFSAVTLSAVQLFWSTETAITRQPLVTNVHRRPDSAVRDYFGVKQLATCERNSNLNKTDCELSISEATLAEVRRLREENARLQGLLIEHGIRIPETPVSTGATPRTASAAPDNRNPGVGNAEQRITLFRSLFRGRDDVYAIRWENADGRSGYMPKADRDWESYLRAKDEERRKVDRLTRKFRPLTDDVVRAHLVGEHGRDLPAPPGRDLLVLESRLGGTYFGRKTSLRLARRCDRND